MLAESAYILTLPLQIMIFLTKSANHESAYHDRWVLFGPS